MTYDPMTFIYKGQSKAKKNVPDALSFKDLFYQLKFTGSFILFMRSYRSE